MNLLHDVSRGEKFPETINAIIENPYGNHNKYEVDKETGLLMLDRVLYGSNFYPFNYGYVPQTHWEDGDPIDVAVYATNPLAPLCLVEVRPIGVCHMNDSGDSDDKIIAVPVKDPRFAHVKSFEDLGAFKADEMKHLFETMNLLQPGKDVKVTGFGDAAKALEVLKKSVELYQKKYGK